MAEAEPIQEQELEDQTELNGPQGIRKDCSEFKSVCTYWEDKRLSGIPIVNEYSGDVEDLDRGHEMTFTNSLKRIDFVLVWEKEIHKTTRQLNRETFEENLLNEGLELEHDEEEGRQLNFTKVHAPLDLLLIYAEILHIRLPIKECPEDEESEMGVWDMMDRLVHKVTKPFELPESEVPKVKKRYSYTYEKAKKYLYCLEENQNLLFSHATRSRIVDYILRRKEYTSSISIKPEFGIRRLLSNGTYKAAYPLHEGSWKSSSKMNMRKLLYDNWANWRCLLNTQPLNYIRVYFGEKVGLYFAWLGYYTYSLILPSVVGLMVFLYGALSLGADSISKESCDPSNNFTMCPLCNKFCGFWNLDQICTHIKATHMFDNGATVFFAIFMSFWATIYLEFWKREQAGIQFQWDLRNFQEEEEPLRPEYHTRCAKSKYKKLNKETHKLEPFFPYWRRQVPVFLTNCTIVLFLVLLALAAVVGVIFYRISVKTAFFMSGNEMVFKNATIMVSCSAAFINLIIIFILNFFYNKLAVVLTDWECLKTQSEYDNSLTFKFYILQFVNYYSSLFYIAFFKGRLGSEAKYYSGTHRQEECQGSCLTELCIQLSIIFVGKQLIKNTLVEIYLPRVRRWMKKKCCTSSENLRLIQQYKPWQKDFILDELGTIGLFNEYLEMMVQFGFVSLFVAAFPLAPLFALLNNIIELRSDANKFVTQFRRNSPTRAPNIGIWYDVLHGISRFAILVNAFLIAFTSSFIQRQLYTRVYSPTGTMEGFVNNSLSYFNVSDMPFHMAPDASVIKPRYNNTVLCRYQDFREPPWSEDKYRYSRQHWHMLAAQFIFVLIFENIVVLIVALIAYLIPDIPRKLERQMKQERVLIQRIVVETELRRAKGDGQEVLSDEEREGIKRLTDNIFNTHDSLKDAITNTLNVTFSEAGEKGDGEPV